MEKLFAMQDADYRAFHAKLIPNIPYETIIGVRTPALRAFSKEFRKSAEIDAFMAHLPHTYYEENNLHGFLIEFICDFDETVAALDAFLPYVDNWATCDMMNPKSLKKDKTTLLSVIRRWLASDHTYTVRFGIKTLMQYYLGEDFCEEYAEMVLAVKSEEYYVNMMRAWYFATALAFQYEAILPLLAENRMDVFTHNKTIRKAMESFRITDMQKAELRGFLRKTEEKR